MYYIKIPKKSGRPYLMLLSSSSCKSWLILNSFLIFLFFLCKKYRQKDKKESCLSKWLWGHTLVKHPAIEVPNLWFVGFLQLGTGLYPFQGIYNPHKAGERLQTIKNNNTFISLLCKICLLRSPDLPSPF